MPSRECPCHANRAAVNRRAVGVASLESRVTVYLPTIKQLQYLVALRDHGHFGNAAASCFITQSTMSASLRELEALIGVTLVERTRRVVRFTPLGLRMAEQARSVLRETEALIEMAHAEGPPLTGELRMGVIPTIAPFLLPASLPRVRARWPELKLFLREETSQAACDALQRGQLDCVLLAVPYPCGNVETLELFEDELLLAFPPHEDPPARIAAHAIDAQRLLLLEDGHCLKDHALAVCNLPQLRVDARMVGTSLNTLVQMVDNGLGLTLLPEMAVAAGILDGTRIVTRQLDAGTSSRRIALAWRKGSPRAVEFGLLGEALIEAQRPETASTA